MRQPAPALWPALRQPGVHRPRARRSRDAQPPPRGAPRPQRRDARQRAARRAQRHPEPAAREPAHAQRATQGAGRPHHRVAARADQPAPARCPRGARQRARPEDAG